MIFGLNTLPDYQKNGYAAKIMNVMINMARQENRKGLVLTCKIDWCLTIVSLDLKMRVYPQVFMVVQFGIKCDWILDENNSKGKRNIRRKKQKKAAKEELKQMIPTLRGQLNEMTSGLDELNGLLKKITRS